MNNFWFAFGTGVAAGLINLFIHGLTVGILISFVVAFLLEFWVCVIIDRYFE